MAILSTDVVQGGMPCVAHNKVTYYSLQGEVRMCALLLKEVRNVRSRSASKSGVRERVSATVQSGFESRVRAAA